MIISVNKALNILMVLSDYVKPVSLKVIAERTDLNKGTCVRILDTLIETGFVIKQDYGKYILGPNAFYIARHGKYRQKLIDVCKQYVNTLHAKYGETIQISIIENYKRYVIHHVEGEIKILGRDHRGGTMLQNGIYQSSAGRVIISDYRRDDLLDFVRHVGLPEYWTGGNEIKDFSDLERRLKKIRTDGYSIIKTEDGKAIGIAVPIHDAISCSASLGFTCKINKYNSKELDLIIKELKHYASIIGSQLQPY